MFLSPRFYTERHSPKKAASTMCLGLRTQRASSSGRPQVLHIQLMARSSETLYINTLTLSHSHTHTHTNPSEHTTPNRLQYQTITFSRYQLNPHSSKHPTDESSIDQHPSHENYSHIYCPQYQHVIQRRQAIERRWRTSTPSPFPIELLNGLDDG